MPTVENPPARRATTTTAVMIFALGATKLSAKRKVTTTTKVIAQTATKFPPLRGFTTFLTNPSKRPTKVATSGVAPVQFPPMAHTDGATTSVSIAEQSYPMPEVDVFGMPLAKAQ